MTPPRRASLARHARTRQHERASIDHRRPRAPSSPRPPPLAARIDERGGIESNRIGSSGTRHTPDESRLDRVDDDRETHDARPLSRARARRRDATRRDAT